MLSFALISVYDFLQSKLIDCHRPFVQLRSELEAAAAKLAEQKLAAERLQAERDELKHKYEEAVREKDATIAKQVGT